MPPELMHVKSTDGTMIACYVTGDTRIANLDVSTLLLVGGDSPPFLVQPTHRLHQCISSSRLVELTGQQHVAMNSAPELFLKHVLEFLG